MNKKTNYLEIKNVTKAFSSKFAVKDVTLSVPHRSIYGLLGPNGAGKTTLIRMITRIIYPDGGDIFLDGEQLSEKDLIKIGYMPEERGLYKKMKVGEQLIYFLRLRGLDKKSAIEKTDLWLKKLELFDWKDKKAEELSKGMQQKVQFILTVAHEPSLLILDEPFSGLDPVNTQVIKDIILELKEKGVTTIFSTHRMEQVEEMCENIALINDAKVILEDNIWNVKKKFQKNIYRIESFENIKYLEEIKEVKIIEIKKNSALVELNNINSKELLSLLIDKLDIIRFELHLPTLNEIFIQLVGKTNG